MRWGLFMSRNYNLRYKRWISQAPNIFWEWGASIKMNYTVRSFSLLSAITVPAFMEERSLCIDSAGNLLEYARSRSLGGLLWPNWQQIMLRKKWCAHVFFFCFFFPYFSPHVSFFFSPPHHKNGICTRMFFVVGLWLRTYSICKWKPELAVGGRGAQLPQQGPPCI